MIGMMDSSYQISSMIMYDDESVDVRFSDGSQLQLSSCGCEFVFISKRSGPPPATTSRVRQRTRFTTSAYREMTSAALSFRNKYASRPYLPEELIPSAHKQPLDSIDTGVQWPSWPSECRELSAEGETVVKTEDGRAQLKLSPSGEEFSVQFSCRLSQPHRESSGEPKHIEGSYQSTTVVQHHSCLSVPPAWHHPLSLARTHRSEPTGDDAHRTTDEIEASGPTFERNSSLPVALPLTCSAPHRHRWKDQDLPDQDFPSELLKVMWCKGVTYRILGGTVPVVEVSPGDGSVMRSNGILSNYFTHYKPEFTSDGVVSKVKELTHHLKSLPPDVPGQNSVSCLVRRASRILSCYNQAKQSPRLSVLPSCLQEDVIFAMAPSFEDSVSNLAQSEVHLNEHTRDSLSDLVAVELEKIKRFNFLVEHCCTPLRSTRTKEPICETEEPMSERSITEALQRTSRVLQDIDSVLSTAPIT
ncbi:uncharacterized protein C5orf34 homolog isoform 1-T1 [Synchiropus picturatus]